MNQRYFVGANAKMSSEGVSLPAISKIILVVNEENAFEAGNDTGYALEVYCPYGTQQMAYDLLAQARGFVYTGYSAESAQLSPEAELGDGVTVGSTYGMLASRKFSFTPKLTEDIEAPLEKEVDHEYSYEGTLTKEVKRKLTLGASYYGTSITRAHGLEIKHYDASGNPTTRVTLNSETLAFYNANGNKAFYYDSTSGEFKISSSIVVGLDEYEKKAELSTDISTYIDSAAGTAKIVSACSATYLSKTSAAAQYETIEASAQIAQSVSDVQSEISLSASYGSSTIGSNVRALLQLVSNADTSSIEIKADKINFTGVTTFVRPGDNISKLTNNAGYQTSSGVTTIIGNTITTDYIEALNIQVKAANITGQLTAAQIDASALKVNAANITGTLTIGQLPSSVATTSDIPTDVSELNNDSGYQTESGVASIVDGRITANYVEALGITVGAAQISGKLTASQIDANNISASGVDISGSFHSTGVNDSVVDIQNGYIKLTQNWPNCITEQIVSSTFDSFSNESISLDIGVDNNGNAIALISSAANGIEFTSDKAQLSGTWIGTSSIATTSDMHKKHDISNIAETYEVLFDSLIPRMYKYDDGTSNRLHTGFIAQEVENAIEVAGKTTQDFAGFVRATFPNPETSTEEEVCCLRYEEFIALNTWQIQKLKKRVAELEAKLGG